MARKQFKNPEEYQKVFEDYKKSVKDNPKLRHVFVGKDGNSNYEEKERPITWDGFEVYTMKMGYNSSADLSEYCNSENPSYIEFLPLSRAFKKECRSDNIDGGMTGIYNAQLTANINGITSKTETEIKGTLNVPGIPDIGNRK